jgi:hypothetical protein
MHLPLALTALVAVTNTVTTLAASYDTYDEEYAKYMVDFSGAAYCSGTLGHGVEKWDCGACKKHPTVTNSSVITESSLAYTLNGFVAYDSAVDRIVLSISGTDPLNIKDWVDDLDFFKTDYPLCEKYGAEPCQVHEGFLGSYDVGRDLVVSTVLEYTAAHPTAEVHVTGHSLGAIMAVLASLDLTLEHDVKITSILTFGQPRGGDEAFSNFFSSHLSEFRVTHYTDPVPHLPPQTLAFQPFFHHPTTEVYYGQLDSTGPYKVCADAEDKSCSNKNLVDVDLLMHLNYVGFDFISNYIGCKL